MKQLIVLDYDDTYTTDPQLWDIFIKNAHKRGHTIICCTMRIEGCGNEDVIEDMEKHNIPIVYSAEADDKWSAIKEAGYDPINAIWIDDRPMYIYMKQDDDFLELL
jgi:hypothetical protein